MPNEEPTPVPPELPSGPPLPPSTSAPVRNPRIAAGVTAILLGALGVHKFVLGYRTAGIIMLAATLVTCGIGSLVTSVIGLIEGIIYLVKTDEEFERIYVRHRREWF